METNSLLPVAAEAVLCAATSCACVSVAVFITWVVAVEALVVVTRAGFAATAAEISWTVKAWVVVVRGVVRTACVRAATVYEINKTMG